MGEALSQDSQQSCCPHSGSLPDFPPLLALLGKLLTAHQHSGLPKLSSLLRWLAGLNLRMGATCATPPSARGQRVKAAAAVFRACPGWAAKKARRTPVFRPGGRRTPIKQRQQEADKVGVGLVGQVPRPQGCLGAIRWGCVSSLGAATTKYQELGGLE